jgi:hypothetical protein
MITTRQINVSLDKGGKKLGQVSTKDVDASIRVEPKPTKKAIGISTATLADVADIAAKKERDDIMAQRKSVEEGKEETKKPWNKMNSAERKVYRDEKARGEGEGK